MSTRLPVVVLEAIQRFPLLLVQAVMGRSCLDLRHSMNSVQSLASWREWRETFGLALVNFHVMWLLFSTAQEQMNFLLKVARPCRAVAGYSSLSLQNNGGGGAVVWCDLNIFIIIYGRSTAPQFMCWALTQTVTRVRDSGYLANSIWSTRCTWFYHLSRSALQWHGAG